MSTPVFPAFIKLEAKGTEDAKGRFLAAVDQMASAGESRMGEFATTAQTDIDRALRIGPSTKSAFVSDMDAALAQVQTKLSTFGNAARRNLDAALSGKVTATGGIDLDVTGAREAAAVAERRATLARQLADATRNAALAEKDFSQATRLSIAAAKDLAVTETQAAAAARVQADATEKLQAAMQRAGVTAQGFGAANDNLGRATGAQRQGMVQLGYQLNDVATQFASGTGAAQIMGQQLGQTLQAVTLMAGGTSRLAAFLGGPWGIALSTAAIVATPFIGKLYEMVGAADTARTALQKLIDKQREAAAGSLDDTQALVGLNAMRDKRLKLQIELDKANADPKGLQGGVLPKSTRVLTRQFRELQLQIVEAEGAIAATDAKRADIERRSAGTKVEATRAVTGHGAATKAATVAIRDQAEAVSALDQILQGMTRTLKDVQLATAGDITKPFDGMLEKLGGGQSDAVRGAVAASLATAEWNAELSDTVRLLDQIGGAGSALGDIGRVLGAISGGNLSALPGAAGIIGKALGGVTVTSVDADGNRMVRQLGDEFSQVLDRVFGSKGSFSRVLESAGIGSAASQLVLGSGGSGIGSALGGVLGKEAGEALGKGVGGLLGKAAGPLGSIVGGVLGGALGGLLKSTKTGFSVISSKGNRSGGSSSELQRGAAATGDNVSAKLNAIAEQLGGTVGNYDVSIGTRSSGYISVSASGSSQVADKSYKKKNKGGDILYDGKDGEEAARIALLNAIQDGAIAGIRAGAQRLLKAGSDLDKQLQRALDFENVFTTLKGYRDPVGGALDTLDREFTRLQDIFREAGASAGEYADLEALYGLKRAEAIDSANDKIIGSLKDLQKALTVGNETLSLRDRNSAALAAYNPLAQRVQSGDTTAFDAFSQAASDLLDIQRQMFGSTSAFFATQDQVKALTEGAIAGQTSIATASANRDSPFSASAMTSTVNAIDSQTDALVNALESRLGTRLDTINANLIAAARANAANSNTADFASMIAAIGQRGFF